MRQIVWLVSVLILTRSGVFAQELSANEREPFHTRAMTMLEAQNDNKLGPYLAEFKFKYDDERQRQTEEFKRRREAWGRITRPKLQRASRSERDGMTWVHLTYDVLAEKGKNVQWKVVFIKEGNEPYKAQMVDTTGRR